MKEQIVLAILRRMQEHLTEEQLQILKESIEMELMNCQVEQDKREICVQERKWLYDLEDFLMAKALEGKSVKTVKQYRYELSRMLSYMNKDVRKIRDTDISRYLTTYKRIRKVSNQTLKNVRAYFSSFFGWLRDRGRIRRNPMTMVEMIKVERKLKKPYSDEERELLFRNGKRIRDKAIMETLYSTAVRVSELRGLNRQDINFYENSAVVLGKGGKERIVYFNQRAALYLREYLNSRSDSAPALFVACKGAAQRLSEQGIEDIIRRTGIQAGVENAHPHRFRRTAATNALNRGMPVQEVAAMMGHSKVDTTMIYCTVDQEGVRYHHKKYLSA